MSETSLPYAGTQGYAGTDTSKERAERDVRDGTANERQRWVIARLGLKGYSGITVAELREDTGWHHGVASSVLTALHIDKKISRLVDKRGRCKVYVLPEYVDYREESPYKPNSSHKDEVNRLEAGLNFLHRKYDLETLHEARIHDVPLLSGVIRADIELLLHGMDVRDA